MDKVCALIRDLIRRTDIYTGIKSAPQWNAICTVPVTFHLTPLGKELKVRTQSMSDGPMSEAEFVLFT